MPNDNKDNSFYWDDYIIEISRQSYQAIIDLFSTQFELYIILGEKLFYTCIPKLITSIHKILQVLLSHGLNYFQHFQLFSNGSIPKHILARFVYMLMFCELNESLISQLLQLVETILTKEFDIKQEFINIIVDSVIFHETNFFKVFNQKNSLNYFIQMLKEFYYSIERRDDLSKAINILQSNLNLISEG